MDELLRRGQEKIKQLFPQGGPERSRKAVIVVGLLALGLWVASGVYRVEPDEQGVVLRFGGLARVTPPGLRYHWPWPIESVLTPQVTTVNRVEVGFRSASTSPGVRGGGAREIADEALMLTGDENIVDINFVVLWRIQTVQDYLFNLRDPGTTVKAAAESVMREIVGQTPIVQATTEGRRLIETRARELLQQLMVEYGTGISIDEVQLQKSDPPADVIDAFRDVQRAQADRERAQNEAESFSNDIIPRARGEAERLTQEAEAYRQETVARATGEAQRFLSVRTEFEKAQEVTTKRLYLETMEEVLRGMNKVIMDSKAGSPGVVPYLPLPELQRRTPAAPPASQGAGQ